MHRVKKEVAKPSVIMIAFDCRPGAIAMFLPLREAKPQVTSAKGHNGREPYTKDGIQFFEWEDAKDVSKPNAIKNAFGCRPGAIAVSLPFREPMHQENSSCCHFGREPDA